LRAVAALQTGFSARIGRVYRLVDGTGRAPVVLLKGKGMKKLRFSDVVIVVATGKDDASTPIGKVMLDAFCIHEAFGKLEEERAPCCAASVT
jgi:hypothetical protein